MSVTIRLPSDRTIEIRACFPWQIGRWEKPRVVLILKRKYRNKESFSICNVQLPSDIEAIAKVIADRAKEAKHKWRKSYTWWLWQDLYCILICVFWYTATDTMRGWYTERFIRTLCISFRFRDYNHARVVAKQKLMPTYIQYEKEWNERPDTEYRRKLGETYWD
jgi:hypothetical protein